MKILIAEDDLVGRKLLEKFLDKYGRCTLAKDGLEALEKFSQEFEKDEPYDLVFLDIMMPKIDGLKALKVIREMEDKKKLEKNQKTKIIMTSALNDKKTVLESHKYGCEAYMWKPLDIEKLEQILEEMKF
jgi:two-component system chemotaxis response regulator CheY